MLIDHARLTGFVTEIFVAAGAERAVADEVADHLVTANLKGHDSHGVGMVPAYIGNIRAGHLDVGSHARVIRDSGAVLLVDGGMGFGQVVGREAVDLALERVKSTGVVAMGVRNCHHLGRIGAYGERCGRAGHVSIHFVNVVGHAPRVAPWGGREGRMVTNPFCSVIPRVDAEPMVLDMATSAVALGKVRVAWMKGEPVPEGALVDHEGLPTTDASVMFREPYGSLGPFGAHKGYGLAVMCELLGGALAGEWTSQPANPRDNTIVNHMLMFVLDPAAFGGIEQFQSEVEAMTDYLQSTTPGTGFDRVRVPGEPEIESMRERVANGVPIDDNTWQGLVKAAGIAGLAEADIARLVD